ncbi:Transposase [Streptomyces venezuelae]|nr:Transposase [Streptomyces venezuelae]CUM41674.1 hypothetical protein BN2537_12313 [Streptomyces venezuelae]
MCVAPSAATIRRVIALACPGGLADLTGADPAGSDSTRSPWTGKTARGPRHGRTPAAHLLAAGREVPYGLGGDEASPADDDQVVHLPAPLGPRNPVTRPGRTVKGRRSTAVLPP